MNTLRFILTCFFLLLPVSSTCAELEAIITYTNGADQKAAGIIHRLTIPPDTAYQKITDLKTVNIDNYTIRDHKNGVDKYIEFNVNLAPTSTATYQIIFTVERQDISFVADDISQVDPAGSLRHFLRPSANIESDADEIKDIAGRISGRTPNLGEQLLRAYRFPDEILDYRPQKPTSALTALNTGVGDCTEYSYLFVGISRNLGVPARVISGFFFGKNTKFKRPNHHASEIYTGKYGWMPVFPNLGSGKYRDAYEFGKIPTTFITSKRTDAWTWSNFYPKNVKTRRNFIKATVSWEIAIKNL